jgi:YD repeat-containing protein
VVTQLVRSDGRGNSYAHTYHYSNGIFADRKFRAYGGVEEVDPGGLRFTSEFLHDDHLIGRASREQIFEVGVLRGEDRAFYALVTTAAGVTQVQSTATEKTIYEVDGSQTERVTIAYDEFLNVLELEKHGDVSVATDNATTRYTYAQGSSHGVVNRTASIRVFGHDGRLISESTILYDGLPPGTVSIGNATRTTDTVAPGIFVSRSATYDAYGNIVTSTDRNGHTTTFTYDALLHKTLASTTDAEGRTFETESSLLFGRAVRTVDASGNVATFVYDEFGRIALETLPGDECSPLGTKSYVYSSLGDATQQHVIVRATERPVEADTFDTTGYFDGMLRGYRRVSDGEGGPIEQLLDYDYKGRVLRQSLPRHLGDPLEFVTFQHDVFDRVTRTINVDGTSVDVAFVLGGHEVVDQLGHVTRFLTDVYDKVIAIQQVVDGQLLTTTRTFDELGRLHQIVDAQGQVTTTTYDMVGNRTSVRDPSIGLTTYVYDENGNVISATDADGRVLHQVYNRVSQIVRREIPTNDLFGNPTYDVVTFTYGETSDPNAVGRLVHVQDNAGQLEIQYDPRGNVKQRKRTIERLTHDRVFVTGYAHDSRGRRTSITYPDGYVVRYEYNEAGQQSRVVDADGEMIAEVSAYTASGRPLGISYRNGVETTFSYDEHRRLASAATQQPTPRPSLFNPFPRAPDPIQDFDYTYDLRGNIAAIRDRASNNDQDFEYDDRNFLSRAVGSYGDRTYNYDAGGNLVRRADIA